jgi:hypothetical protein
MFCQIMLVLNIIIIDSFNKILKLFSKLFFTLAKNLQSILLENICNIFSNSPKVMNPLFIT